MGHSGPHLGINSTWVNTVVQFLTSKLRGGVSNEKGLLSLSNDFSAVQYDLFNLFYLNGGSPRDIVLLRGCMVFIYQLLHHISRKVTSER